MTKIDVNKYLYYEFGMDGDESSVSEDWPFQLHSIGCLELQGERTEFYEFTDGKTDYYAQEGFFFPKAGMTIDDLYIQDKGQKWIDEQEPMDLNTSVIDDDRVPPLFERRKNIEEMGRKLLGDSTDFKVVEGLFLRKNGTYLALLKIHNQANAVVIGTSLSPISVSFREASSYRRLSHAIGKLLQYNGSATLDS
jgi:hypothetical protein